MSAAFRPEGRSVWEIKVPTSQLSGRRRVTKKRTTDTRDRALARAMETMVQRLARKHRAWDILDRVGANTVTLAHLYDLWVQVDGDVEELRLRLTDVPLSELVEAWVTSIRSRRKDIKADTADHYEAAVRGFLAAAPDMARSRFSVAVLAEYLDTLDRAPATVRKHGSALTQFGDWCVERGHLDRNPMERVALPAAGKPRDLYLTPEQAVTLAKAKREPYRTLDYVLAGTGADLTTALELQRADIDLTTWRVRLRGAKTGNRDRTVLLADFAREAVKTRCAGLLPTAPLFPDIPHRWAASDYHAEVRDALVADHPWLAGFWLRDHRKTWGVRMAKAGAPMQVIANGLGNTLAQTVKTYTQYLPSSGEREHWEQAAADADRTARQAAQ